MEDRKKIILKALSSFSSEDVDIDIFFEFGGLSEVQGSGEVQGAGGND